MKERFMLNKKIFYFRAMFVCIGWFGIVGHIVLKIATRVDMSVLEAVISSISYYTIQTNIIGMVCLTYALIAMHKGYKPLHPYIRAGITLYISLTFALYTIFLAKLWQPHGLEAILSYISHYITPIAVIIDWFLYEKYERQASFKKRYIITWLLYPLLYLGYALTYGHFTGRYMYPFIHLPSLGVISLLRNVSILILLYIILGSVLIRTSQILSVEKVR